MRVLYVEGLATHDDPESCVVVREGGGEALTGVCITRSCVELAGGGPVTVMTKQPCSRWAMEGETRLSKPHDKVALGGKQACGPYDEEACVSVVTTPRENGI